MEDQVMTDETAVEEKPVKAVMTEEDLFQGIRALEALLFTSQDLMTEKELSQFFAPNTDVELLLEHLQQQYQNRGVNVVKRGTGWGLRTSPDLAEKLEVRKIETRALSRAAIETLAIIAYHQPVTRAEIEQIRGVSISKSTFELLVAETLIKPGKRRDVVGRPLTWITTRNFLDSFGLESIKELPNLQELKEAGLLSTIPPQLANMEQPSLPLLSEEDSDEPVEDYTDDEFETNTGDQTQEGETDA
jgi:segregation and condensation protein B